jgi:beta-lactamase superfamily II metal-dependent hydrolase
MLTVVFWDVQHGSAAYIRTPGGRHIVVDLGIGSYGGRSDFSPLVWLKERRGVGQLDGVIITHPHRDHLDDIFNLQGVFPRILYRPRHLSQQSVREGNRAADWQITERYLELDKEYAEPVAPVDDPLEATNNGGAEMRIFSPRSCSASNLNNHSIVTVLSYAGSKMIIPGDNETASWDELLLDPAFAASIRGTDILVAAHHGREAGYSNALFQYIRPKLTVISDGRYGDTSAVGRYGQKMAGWTVHKRSGGAEERKCVTTRSDGVIVVEFGENQPGRPFIEVTID